MPNGGTMACPVDGSTLVMSERSGIEIDYCPQCRGVWLDRGELDKIIERNAASAEPATAQASAPSAGPMGQPPQQGHWGHPPQYQGHHKPYKKRKSFLEELFD